MAQVKFYRGKKEDYVLEEHLDGVYFATDTEEVVMNGKEYGKDPDWNEIDAVLLPPNNEIWYTSSNGSIIDLSEYWEGEQPISNTYENGKGIMVFANDVTDLTEAFDFEGREDDETQLASVVIPNSVTSVGEYAFYGCSGLTSVNIPNSVTSIGGGAFRECTGLTSITIPNSVTSIGSCTFQSCTGLTSIEIPDSVTRIGDAAFDGCSGLTSITIPDSVTSISDSAFYDCSGLTSVTYNDTTYTSKSALTSALTNNGVTVGNNIFNKTSLSA